MRPGLWPWPAAGTFSHFLNSGVFVTVEDGSGRVAPAAFSPDGKMLVTTNADGTVRLWDVESGQSP